jgi:hypothetical protein
VSVSGSGSGSGVDWNNTIAWSSISSTGFVRGNTYYIADGVYGSKTFSTPQSGTTWIYLKKATELDHGTSTGWSSTYGDGTAQFTSTTDEIWEITSPYWEFDGQTGGGPDNWEGPFGFTVTPVTRTDTANAYKGILLSSSSADYITFKHIEMKHQAFVTINESLGQSFHLFHALSGSSNIHVSHSWFHQGNRMIFAISGASNWTIEYSKLGDNRGSNSGHSEIFNLANSNSNMTFRYNYFYKWSHAFSTGAIVCLGSPNNNISIYGNIFDQTDTSYPGGWYTITCGWSTWYPTSNDWKIYNNTFVNIKDGAYLFTLSNSSSTGDDFSNNIIYDDDGSATVTFTANGGSHVTQHDYSWFSGTNGYGESNGLTGGSTDPFEDSSSADRLSSIVENRRAYSWGTIRRNNGRCNARSRWHF